jgi:pimeloyl-ACP methyl ester carboxylesterase
MISNTTDGIYYVSGHWPIDELKPTIIFIHGSGGSHVLWNNQVEALSPFANTIALDLPGHGQSKGEGKDNIPDYADVVRHFIESLGIDQPIPCGLSIGGAIALQLLIDKKQSYRGGILINTGARLKVMPMIFDTIKKDYNASIEATKLFAISEKTNPEKVEPLIEEMRKCGSETAYNDFKACDGFNVMEGLSSVDIPVLVMTAEDDKLTPPKYGLYLAEHIPQSSMAEISEAGHLSPLENGEKVNEAIIDFLKSLP